MTEPLLPVSKPIKENMRYILRSCDGSQPDLEIESELILLPRAGETIALNDVACLVAEVRHVIDSSYVGVVVFYAIKEGVWYRSIKKGLVTMSPVQIGLCVLSSVIITGNLAPLVRVNPLLAGAVAGGVTAGLLSRKPRPPEETFGPMD